MIIFVLNKNFRHLDPTTYGDYPQSMKDSIGHRLPKFTEAEKAKLKNSADFVGINYYTSVFAVNINKADSKSPSWTMDSLVDWDSKYSNFLILINSIILLLMSIVILI